MTAADAQGCGPAPEERAREWAHKFDHGRCIPGVHGERCDALAVGYEVGWRERGEADKAHSEADLRDRGYDHAANLVALSIRKAGGEA